MLQRRLIDIYKRGPLYTFEALLSAQSFGELVARYKYLHLLALRDRALVERVEELRNQVRRQRGNLVRLQSDIERTRGGASRSRSERLRELERERARSLAAGAAARSDTRGAARAASRATSSAHERDRASSRQRAGAPSEARRGGAARAARSGRATSGGSTGRSTATIIYRFGRVVNPNNTTTRWNGIGIAAASGTPVKAVAAGEVVVAETFGTYGLTVIVQHGGGDYSVYGSLSRHRACEGRGGEQGRRCWAVGAADPELPAHLHFEMRPQGAPWIRWTGCADGGEGRQRRYRRCGARRSLRARSGATAASDTGTTGSRARVR